MAELGRWLRDAREAKNLSLDGVEKEIRIRSHYLQALEEEAFDRLPGEVCARGFLRNYALFLGLDPEEAIARYRALVPASEEELSTSGPAKLAMEEYVEVPLDTQPHRRRPVLIAGILLLVLALLGAGWWYYTTRIQGLPFTFPWQSASLGGSVSSVSPTPPSALSMETPGVEPTSPSEEQSTPAGTTAPLPTSTSTATPSPTATRTRAPTITATATPSGGVNLEVELIDYCWMQVTVDDENVFEGFLEVGETRTWHARDRIVLRVGNAGGVRARLNGQDLGVLGEPGQVLDLEWAREGVPLTLPTPAGPGPVAEGEASPTPTATTSTSAPSPSDNIARQGTDPRGRPIS